MSRNITIELVDRTKNVDLKGYTEADVKLLQETFLENLMVSPVHIELGFLTILGVTMDYLIDSNDFSTFYADVAFYVSGARVLHGRIDTSNPKLSGIFRPTPITEVVAEIGVDFKAKRIYIKGHLEVLGRGPTFDIALVEWQSGIN